VVRECQLSVVCDHRVAVGIDGWMSTMPACLFDMRLPDLSTVMHCVVGVRDLLRCSSVQVSAVRGRAMHIVWCRREL